MGTRLRKSTFLLIGTSLLLATYCFSPLAHTTNSEAEIQAQGVDLQDKPGNALPPEVEKSWWASVQEDMAKREYHATKSEGIFQAPNRVQNFRTGFSKSGVTVKPRSDEGGWSWELSLVSWGRKGSEVSVLPVMPVGGGHRVEYRRGAITEWYVNTSSGLEQGFTVNEKPEGEGELRMKLRSGGTLKVTANKKGEALTLADATGPKILFGKLYAEDAMGRALKVWFEEIEGGFALVVNDTDALYPLLIDPLATTPDWTRRGQEGQFFGWSVAGAGDVNGDGFSDVIIGAPGYDNGEVNEGMAFLYLGTASGLSTTPAWTGESNQFMAYFGNSVAGAGDVNGDGYSDVIVGALYNGQGQEGKAFVYLGSATGLSASPAWTKESDQGNAYFGKSVACAGDVNGDGYSDVIIGAPGYDSGRAFVYLGSATGLTAAPTWTGELDQDAHSWFGNSVAGAGDVNGDGYSDIIVGARQYQNGEINEGAAFVYPGSPTGLATTPAWIVESDTADAWFGWAVAGAGDVNSDGYSDVIVGAPRYSNGEVNEGKAFVYLGSATGLSASPAWTKESDQGNAYFGKSVACAGDVNGDGYSDVIIGAPDYNRRDISDRYRVEGRAFFYLGSAAGLPAFRDWAEGPGRDWDEHFGRAVAGAGDVNGDGYSDVIIGAGVNHFNIPHEEGFASLYLGLPPPPPCACLYSHSGELPEAPTEAHAAGAAFYNPGNPEQPNYSWRALEPFVVEFWREQLTEGGPLVPLVRIIPPTLEQDQTPMMFSGSDTGYKTVTFSAFSDGIHHENITLHTGDWTPFSGPLLAPTTFILDQNILEGEFDDTGPFELWVNWAIIEIPAYGTPPPWPKTEIHVSHHKIDFGKLSVDDHESKRRNIVVRNDGDTPLEIFRISGLGTTMFSGGFTGDAGCRSDITLDGGSSCTIEVSFTPSEGKDYESELHMHSEDPARPDISIILTGRGTEEPDFWDLAVSVFEEDQVGCFIGVLTGN